MTRIRTIGYEEALAIVRHLKASHDWDPEDDVEAQAAYELACHELVATLLPNTGDLANDAAAVKSQTS
jgi:hypothetical protein